MEQAIYHFHLFINNNNDNNMYFEGLTDSGYLELSPISHTARVFRRSNY